MSSALLVRFRPAGPWRLGPDNGARTQAGKLLHSDSLYSAITLAMRDCGWMDEWIAATAESETPAVRISSGYPFTGSTLLVVPPRTVWPPPQGGKLRWKTARFVPLTLVPRLLAGEELVDDQWAVDPVSECLLPVFRNSVAAAPFRVVLRVLAPVDRVTGATENVDRVACLQFAQGGGIWFIAEFADDAARSTWAGRMRSVARLLADSGIGGGRSRGWGRSREPQFGNVDLPEFLTGIAASAEGETAWWTVSLFSPAEADKVEWDRGTYTVVVRAGRTENGELKPASRMVAEGSVLVSGSPPAGTARNVSPADLSHAVYRSGIALAVRIPFQQRQRWELVDHAAAPALREVAAEAESSVPVPGEIPSGGDTAWDASAEVAGVPGEADVEAEASGQEPLLEAGAEIDEPSAVAEKEPEAQAAEAETTEFSGDEPALQAFATELPGTLPEEPEPQAASEVAAEPEAIVEPGATHQPSGDEPALQASATESLPEPGAATELRDADEISQEAVAPERAPDSEAGTEPGAQELPLETSPGDLTERHTTMEPENDSITPLEERSSPLPPDQPDAKPASTGSDIVDEIPVGVDFPATDSPAEQPEAAEDVTATDVVPGEDPNAAGIEPAADKPEDAGHPTKDEEDQP